MNVSKVTEVKKINKNNRDMYLVTLEGKNYMCFDKKWADLKDNTVKYDLVVNDKGFTNVELKEIVAGPTNDSTDNSGVQGTLPEITPFVKTIDAAVSYTMSAANSFIQSGMIKSPDEWIGFLDAATPMVKDFLERTTEAEKTI